MKQKLKKLDRNFNQLLHPMKKMTNTFRILMMFGMLFVFTKCEESELQVENIDSNIENSGFRQLNFDELPIEIRQEFTSQPIPLNSAGSIIRNRRSSLFGELKRDKVNRVKRENGSASYTIALENNSKGFYYDNLVVQQDSLGNLQKNIIRYEPDKEWFEKSKGRYDYSNYTGIIYFFNEKEELITSSYFNLGIPNSSKPFDLKGNVARQTSSGSSCFIIPHFSGVELGGVISVYNTWFDIRCPNYDLDSALDLEMGGDSGDYGIGTTPMGEENAGDGGAGASSEEVSSEEEQIVNNLTNPCASEIFTELENGLWKDDPLKAEILLPKDKLGLNFSQSILKLFNDSNTFKYVISNENLLNAEGEPSGANASTTGAKTTLNNIYLANATQLSIARTMIHEMVHAFLNNVYFNRPDFENKSLLEKMRSYATDNGYTDYMRFHHEFMGQYVNAMAFSLFEWDKEFGSGGNLGWNYYQAMAFGGLYYKIKDEEGN
ncbi:MAG: hypothetical protein CVU07_10700, partial [Bacteroidetes bacterium HGW-Bacteroidetes-23]